MKRNPNFDILRGILASWVVVIHALWLTGIHGGWVARSGQIAVDMFIVLSGYVISKSMLIKRPTYGAFISQRFWRIFPAFAVCLAFALAIRPLTLHTSPTEFAREAAENHWFWPQLIAHLSLLFGLVPNVIMPEASGAFLPPAWSISLEMQLYIVTPLLLWAIARFRWSAAAVLGAFSALAFFPPVTWRLADYMSPLGAFLPQKIFFFLVGMGCCIANRVFWQYQDYDIALLPLPGAVYLMRLGTWSYSLYLIHYPVLHLTRAMLPAMPAWTMVTMLLLIGGPISVGLAALLHIYVELPGIQLGRKLSHLTK